MTVLPTIKLIITTNIARWVEDQNLKKTVLLSVTYECEAWYLTFKKGHELKVTGTIWRKYLVLGIKW